MTSPINNTVILAVRLVPLQITAALPIVYKEPECIKTSVDALPIELCEHRLTVRDAPYQCSLWIGSFSPY